MDITFTHKVVYVDGSETTVKWGVTPALIFDAERTLETPYAVRAGQGFATPMMFGVWWTLRKQSKTPLEFKQWIEATKNVLLIDSSNPLASDDDEAEGEEDAPKDQPSS